MSMDVNVGDTVVVEIARPRYHGDNNRPDQTKTGTVVKVARKYFTVQFDNGQWATEDQYEIASGRQRPQNPQYTNYLDRAYLPDAYEAELARREVLRRIRQEHKAYGDYGGTMALDRWSDGHLIELLDLLDRVKGDAS